MVSCAGYDIKKRSNAVDDASLVSRQGDSRFRRWEYWGYESYYILHYTGDHTIFTTFGHRNSKNTSRPFIRSAPFVKEKVRIINIYIQLLTIIRILYFNKIELLTNSDTMSQ